MNAARACFARVGYERATNRDIGAEAGVTAAAIYQYFKSKTDLYVGVAAESIEELMPRLRAAVSGTTTARAALSAIVREQLSLEQHASSARFLAGVPVEMQRHPEVAQAMLAQPGTFFELVLDVIKLGVRNGEITRDKAESVLAMFMAGVMGLSIHGATVGGSHSAAATQGFMELLEGKLFE